MRDVTGRIITVNGRDLYGEESGTGPGQVVFEAGMGCGRTCWDLVVPLLRGQARTMAYDRAGSGRSPRIPRALSLEDKAADLAGLIESAVPGEFVLVAHSMGGLVARLAFEKLSPRVAGLLLIDPTPETSPIYDTIDSTAARVDRMLSVTQLLAHVAPLRGLATANLRRLYTEDTYRTMLAEDAVPAGIAQTRAEFKALAESLPQFRKLTLPAPECPTVVLSAGRAERRAKAATHASIQAHQRSYVDSLPAARFESVESGHFIQAEQPELVAERIRELLG